LSHVHPSGIPNLFTASVKLNCLNLLMEDFINLSLGIVGHREGDRVARDLEHSCPDGIELDRVEEVHCFETDYMVELHVVNHI